MSTDKVQRLERTSFFSQQLQLLRERRKISRKVLGELCGMSRNAVGKYERGEQQPTLETAIKLADYFEISVDYLIGHENSN